MEPEEAAAAAAGGRSTGSVAAVEAGGHGRSLPLPLRKPIWVQEEAEEGGTGALARLLSNSTLTALAMRMKIENKEMISILSRFMLHSCSTDE